MNILIVGDWHSSVHEECLKLALEELGHKTHKFSWHQNFNTDECNFFYSFFLKVQNKFIIGPIIRLINNDLIFKVKLVKPDVIFLYRGTHIWPGTIRLLKSKGIKIVSYNNDDAFSKLQPKWRWRHFIKSIVYSDICLAYRHCNIEDLKQHGAKCVYLFRSWFVPNQNFKCELNALDKKKYQSDVVFAGHYENDGRLEVLEEVLKQGWTLKLYGHSDQWSKPLRSSKILRHLNPIQPVWGKEYNMAINGAKVALCFMSKMNRDTYTRRCFEIPASGTALMAEYSKDLDDLFVDNESIILFKNINEFKVKLNLLLGNDKQCNEIAQNGLKVVWKDGHDLYSRVEKMIETIDLKL